MVEVVARSPPPPPPRLGVWRLIPETARSALGAPRARVGRGETFRRNYPVRKELSCQLDSWRFYATLGLNGLRTEPSEQQSMTLGRIAACFPARTRRCTRTYAHTRAHRTFTILLCTHYTCSFAGTLPWNPERARAARVRARVARDQLKGNAVDRPKQGDSERKRRGEKNSLCMCVRACVRARVTLISI